MVTAAGFTSAGNCQRAPATSSPIALPKCGFEVGFQQSETPVSPRAFLVLVGDQFDASAVQFERFLPVFVELFQGSRCLVELAVQLHNLRPIAEHLGRREF